jgi:DNA-binding transcriptional ArsR family regulator
MSSQTERLERLITEESGGCCDADLEERLESLRSYRSVVPTDPDADLTALKTLGNDTRYSIVRLLKAADRELCVCEINPIVEVSDSAISHALSDLYDAGLVTRRKDGTWRYYETTDRAEALLAALDETRAADR